MRETIKFILFCLSWFFLLIGVSPKPSINEYPSDSEILDRQEKEFGLKKEKQSLQQIRSISKPNQKPTNGVTGVAFGSTPFSIATLEKISRSKIEKPQRRTKRSYPLRTRTTGGKKQISADAFTKWINAIVSNFCCC